MATISRKRASLPGEGADGEWALPVKPGEVVTFDEPEPEPEQSDVDRVSEMLSTSVGFARSSLKVFKVENGIQSFCDSYDPQQFEDGDFSMIRADYGAGRYKMMLYGADPVTNKFSLRRRVEVTISEKKSDGKNAAPIDSGMTQLLTSIAQGQEKMLNALVEMKQAPQRDPMDELTKMMALMTTMREAMGLNAPQQSQKSSISEIVTAVRELREVSSEISPDKGGDGDLSAMLPQVLSIIQSGMEKNSQPAPPGFMAPLAIPQSLQGVANQPQSVANPQQNENVANPQQSEGENMNFTTMLALRGYLATLTQMAVDNKPFADGAMLVYEKLPDELVELMAHDNWFYLLAMVAPDVKKYPDWMKLARDAALSMFDEAEPEPANAAKVDDKTQ
jgi:hypothetical protein